MQPTPSGGIYHLECPNFQNILLEEVPEVSMKPLGLLLLSRGVRESVNYFTTTFMLLPPACTT